MIEETLFEAEAKMEQAIGHLQAQFATVRTGRANPALLHRVMVDYYGSSTPLQQLASFSVPEPRMLLVHPYDRSSIGVVERAILASDLGLNPSNDGTVIRLAFPPLTEERRRELIRLVRHMAEETRVAVRNVRRDVISDFKDLKKEGEISEDDEHRAEEEVQKLTDGFIEKINDLLHHKEEEILEI